MRLLNTKTLGFEEFMNEKTLPKYAILSHTWGAEEVTYQDLRDGIPPAVQQKTGFTKIKWTCQQAKAEGLEFCWVDTCCIDKSSSAEISEAINSMFRYYNRSAICYARTSKSLRAPPLTYIRAHGLIVDVRCDQHDQITVYVVTVK
jgi:hypothetical protein